MTHYTVGWHNSSATLLHHGPHHRGDCAAAGGVRSPQHSPRPHEEQAEEQVWMTLWPSGKYSTLIGWNKSTVLWLVDANNTDLWLVLRCSRCCLVYYCDAQCQRKHWKKHKSLVDIFILINIQQFPLNIEYFNNIQLKNSFTLKGGKWNTNSQG